MGVWGKSLSTNGVFDAFEGVAKTLGAFMSDTGGSCVGVVHLGGSGLVEMFILLVVLTCLC